jgi:transposase
VLSADHQLWQIEKSFRMSKSDLRARPIYHHKRDSIEAHLTIVMAALAVSRWLERVTAGRSRSSSRRYAATAASR